MALSQNLEKLKRVLAELFQLDQAELDFGIYRIMNTKREEIVRFLDRDLLPQVRKAFEVYEAKNRGAVEAELTEAVEKAKELGIDPESTQKVKEIRARLAQAVDVTALENEVYSHLYNFFRRYYQEGDFISLRRYKEGVYAIPYEGEEVKLYWANHDQYYIKTSEYLRDYTFKLPSGKRVHFKLAEADTEKDNNRAANGNERRFILSAEQPVAEENGELVVRFDYRPHPAAAKQADLNAAAVDRILNQTTGLDDWRRELASPRPTEKNPSRTLLEKHLADYTARNTFDYFIHKDLGGFLRRELDFYIKNEVMHLDDIEDATVPHVEQYLSKIKAIRRIAHKIIDFLAQIEDFQKKLWLKKKFVVETQYCITLDRIYAIEDEKARDWLLDQIVKNDPQREEWVRLYGDMETWRQGDGATASLLPEDDVFVSLSPGLRVPKSLTVDTRHFDEAFKLRLLAAIPDLDEMIDGVLVHADNLQTLRLLNERYRGELKSIYIDPPYNTGNDRFIYKDSYQHSSWLTMMADRLALMVDAVCDDGTLFVSIDANERDRLGTLAEVVLGAGWYLNTFVWINNLKGRQISGRGAAGTHEYVLAFGGRGVGTLIAPVTKFKDLMPSAYKGFGYETQEDAGGAYVIKNELYNTNSKFNEETRPNLVFSIHYNFATGEVRFSDAGDDVQFEGFVKIPPKANNDGVHKYHAWRWGKERIERDKADLEFVRAEDRVRIYTKVRGFETTTLKDVITDISTSVGGNELFHLLGAAAFTDYPKPVALVEVFASQAGDVGLIADFFAGSGTTGHAVINLNREDGGRRKFILVEMGDYFDTVLVPRIKKVIFTPEWKDGKPKRMPTPEEVERSPRIVKILRLESYEDTLNNLELKRTEAQQSLLEQKPAFREDYVLRYMLDVEARESPSLLNVERFEDPFKYTLNIATSTAGETKATVVDLVETFNYLIGLRVKTIDCIRGVRVVTGTNPQGERVLILWRKTKALDNDALNAWFRTQDYNIKDQEYDIIYVNGDNNLENLRRPDQTWKVRLIEEEFRRLMFDVQDV